MRRKSREQREREEYLRARESGSSKDKSKKPIAGRAKLTKPIK